MGTKSVSGELNNLAVVELRRLDHEEVAFTLSAKSSGVGPNRVNVTRSLI